MAKIKKKSRSQLKNPRAVRLSTNLRVANASNMQLVQSVDDHVRWLKNQISAYCHANLLELVCNPYEFKKRYSQYKSKYLVAWEVQQLFHSIVDNYLSCFKQRIEKKQFKIQKSIKIERYKKNGKGYKAGDLKSFYLNKVNSCYTGLIKYLCYCPDLSLEKLIPTKIGKACAEVAESKPVHWEKIVGFVKQVQQNLIKKIKVFIYTSGSYQRNVTESRSFVFTDETNAKYKCFYQYKTGKGKDARVVRLPLLTNRKKHDFKKIKCDGNHLVYVKNGKFHIALTQEAQKIEPKAKHIVVGGDMNCKSNLIVFSNGLEIRYDEKYLDRLIAQLQKLDAKGNNKSRKDRKKLEKICRRNEWYFQHFVHDTLDLLEKDAVTDIVLEDLNRFPATFLKHRELTIRYSRLIRLLRLSNLKNWFLEQAHKRGIRVHLTPPQYTSQRCAKCGFIHEKNRKTQENFVCIECGYQANADHNASLNIKERWTSDVLRSSLHDIDEFGRLTARPMFKNQIRKVLENVAPDEDFTVLLPRRVKCIMPLALAA